MKKWQCIYCGKMMTSPIKPPQTKCEGDVFNKNKGKHGWKQV